MTSLVMGNVSWGGEGYGGNSFFSFFGTFFLSFSRGMGTQSPPLTLKIGNKTGNMAITKVTG